MHNNSSSEPLQNRIPKVILQTIVFKSINFQDFHGLALIFQDFPVLENAE